MDEDHVVEVAAEAAESAVFAEYDRSAIADFDVTVRFVDGELSIDVLIDASADSPGEAQREERVANEAMAAARAAADEVLEPD